MWKKNEKKSIPGRTCWDIYCMNCNSYLGSTDSGDDHTYERGGNCPYCGKDVNEKEEKGDKK